MEETTNTAEAAMDAATTAAANVDAETVATTLDATAQLGQFIGAGLTAFGMLGAAIGVGLIFAAAMNAVARNPAKEGSIKFFTYLGFALAEFMGLLAFVLAMIILG